MGEDEFTNSIKELWEKPVDETVQNSEFVKYCQGFIEKQKKQNGYFIKI